MKHLNILSLILIMTVLVSCYQEPDTTDNFDMQKVIPKEKMVDVLTDIHLLEGVISAKQRKGLKTRDFIGPYKDAILEKHQVTREEFEESVRYYTYHIDELDEIYEQVIVNLSKKESEVMNSKES